jgi:hypothetical protein
MLLKQPFCFLLNQDLSFNELQVPGRGFIHDFFRLFIQQWVKWELRLRILYQFLLLLCFILKEFVLPF